MAATAAGMLNRCYAGGLAGSTDFTATRAHEAAARAVSRSPLFRAGSARLVACKGDAMHHPPVPVIVVQGVVLRAAVVPERERAHAPAEPAGELGTHLVPIEELQQRRALLLGQVLEAHGVADVYVERLAPGLRMGANDRVLGHELFGR